MLNSPLNPSDVMPLKVVKTLLRVVAAQGYDVDQVIQTIGLSHNPLLHDSLGPGSGSNHTTNKNQNNKSDSGPKEHEQYVSTLIYSKLYKHVMDLLQDESFGLSSYGKLPPGTFRMMCLFIIHCKTLQQAMSRAAEFYDYLDRFNQRQTITRQPISVGADESIAVCRFYNPNTPHRAQYLQADASVLYMMHRFYSWLIGQNIPLLEVHFSSPPPQDLRKYEDLFKCPVTYNEEENVILFPAEYLDSPLAQTEDSLRDFLRTAPYQLVTKTSDIDLQSIKTKVRLMLEKDMRSEFPGIEVIAQRMNISSRTLHRRLRRENSSFQEIKDDIRRDAAIAYMTRPELTINAVSVLMGFQDTSAFYRAFKKWTGMSPGDYRKSQLLHDHSIDNSDSSVDETE